MIRGPHYVLGSTVITVDYLNRYTATSDYGHFDVSSDTKLRRLVREIAAIAELKKVEDTDAFAGAAAQAGKSVYRSAKNLIDDPVATLSAIPDGLGSIFGRVTEQTRRSGKSQYEDSTAKEVLAVSSYKRDYAAKLGVDAYSSNAVLQEELNRVAWASAAGNLSLGALSVATGAVALQVASNVRTLEQARNIVEATPPSEVSRRNREQLQRMKVPAATINGLLGNPVLSPRHQTVIVAAVAALGNIPGRADFLADASQADTEDAAFLFQQMAELLAGYSASVAPVRRIVIVANIPIAVVGQGKGVVLLPVDRLLWTERNADIAQTVARNLPKSRGVKATEVWITGDASPRAKTSLAKLGLGLTQRCGTRIPLLD